jgi:hypothetical protein
MARVRWVLTIGLTGILAVAIARAVAAAEKPRVETITLFNGTDLDGWYTYTVQTKYENPGIFTVVDGMLKISGGAGDVGYFGGIITRKEYDNYRLVVEYKFGEPTYGTRKDRARDSGILVHCVGPDGPGPWPASVECQIIEGGTGDIILVGGKGPEGKPIQHSIVVEGQRRGGQIYYQPGAPDITASGGRINWFARDPQWRDVVGFRGRHDVESPFGEWTRVECVCRDDTITNIVNGKVVNRARGLALSRGRVLIQTEGAEIWIRKIELTPMGR